MQRIVTFKIDIALLRLLDRYARRRRLTRSEVIREAIIKLLESEGIKVSDEVKKLKSEEKRQDNAFVIEVPV